VAAWVGEGDVAIAVGAEAQQTTRRGRLEHDSQPVLTSVRFFHSASSMSAAATDEVRTPTIMVDADAT
jgi:hypothetical protein